MLGPPHLTDPSALIAYGLGYHSQNNDFKIVRIVVLESKVPPVAEAEVYTLSTDSWRRVVISLESEPNIGYIDFIDVLSPGLFFNGALHSTVFSGDYKFILSFDVNDETFRPIMLPQNFFDEMLALSFDSLGVFKGSLALFVCGENLDGDVDVSHIWVMREYGVVESWTKIIVPVDSAEWFWGCTDSGELLLNTFERGLVSYDLESLNENNFGIQNSPWLSYTADLMESLVLLDQGQGQVQDPDILLPTWSVPMYRPDGSVAEIPIPRLINVMGYPISLDSRQATLEDLEELILMVEGLKLEGHRRELMIPGTVRRRPQFQAPRGGGESAKP
uniref:F-box associated beta-propeller type 1 domain-containing protein n=1 Tax=Fagus sylvatica TaxID=28930 RepID=A0A2N9ECY2_FAGSY